MLPRGESVAYNSRTRRPRFAPVDKCARPRAGPGDSGARPGETAPGQRRCPRGSRRSMAKRSVRATGRARARHPRRGPLRGVWHPEQAASRHDEDDLERLRLTAAREGSVPWFEARWRLALLRFGEQSRASAAPARRDQQRGHRPANLSEVWRRDQRGARDQSARVHRDLRGRGAPQAAGVRTLAVLHERVCSLVIRARAALPVKRRARKPLPPARPSWNVFDSLIVALSFSDKAFFSVFRIARVPHHPPVPQGDWRLGQVVPLALMWVLLLILLVIYMFAVLGVLLFRDGPYGVFFASIGDAMFTLLQVAALETWSGSCDATLEDCVDGIARPMIARYPGAWLYFVLYCDGHRVLSSPPRGLDPHRHAPPYQAARGRPSEKARRQAGQAPFAVAQQGKLRRWTSVSRACSRLARRRANSPLVQSDAADDARAALRRHRHHHERRGGRVIVPRADDTAPRSSRTKLAPRRAQAAATSPSGRARSRRAIRRNTAAAAVRRARCPVRRGARQFGGLSRVWVQESRTCTSGETNWR